MTQEEILEYNKRCAEFLEYEFDELSETYETPHLKLVEPQAFGDEQFSCKLKIYELDFHSDWNWIMKVVEAIEKLDFGIKQCRKVVEIYRDSNKENLFYCKKSDRKESIIEAINQFLIWYNNEQNKH